jgi:hypothetical protein
MAQSVHRLIGFRSGRWRAEVNPSGTVIPSDGSPSLAWHVAADDRWYSPPSEPTVRQKWYGGYPVVETRMKVPSGDIVQRVYCIADLGGLTVMEFENESTLPVAVAVTRRDVLTTRPQIDNPPQGIDLPEDSIVLPLAHAAVTRVGLLHDRPHMGRLPDDIPSHQEVVRGWESACNVASRINVPDHTLTAGVSAIRSSILLGDDSFLHSSLTSDGSSRITRRKHSEFDDFIAIEAARLGETHDDSVIEIVDALQRRIKKERRARVLSWDTPHVFSSAAWVCEKLGEDTAAADIGRTWLRMADTDVEPLPLVAPTGPDMIAWVESLLVRAHPDGGVCTVLPFGIPEPWWGAHFECHDLIADPRHRMSYAIRWHGTRPALLWEVSGEPGLVVAGGATNEEWHSTDMSGETLLALPQSHNT